MSIVSNNTDSHPGNPGTSNLPSYSTDIAPPTVHNASVVKTYANRSVFLTGATGFVGKVILEKLMRSTPDVRRIFVLVRPRKNQSPQERLKQEVLTSPIFGPLRESNPHFDQFCDEKLVAVAGELTSEEVGLSSEDYQRLSEELDIIIHCAAVVDFNERIDRAIELNTLGSLRMLELGKKCKHLGAFVHVSTCYVNSNRPNGHIEERLYPLGFDPEEMIDRVSKMSSSELDTVLSTGILGSWPNTYTMTKAMTEHLLVKYKGDIPLAIVRPSIVGCAWSEPIPGWVDVISAAGAVYIATGMGVIRFLEGLPSNVGDLIPVDYVSNSIIVAAAIAFNKWGTHFICHAASSSENPMHWGKPLSVVVSYFGQHPPPRSIAPVDFKFATTPQIFQLRFFLEYSIPSAILNTLALTGNEGYQHKAQLFQKLLWQTRVLTEAFKHFVMNQWEFDNRNVRSLYSMIAPEEQQIFPLTLSDLDWYRYSDLFCFGLLHYTMKMPLLPAFARDARYISVTDNLFALQTYNFRHRWFPNASSIYDLYHNRIQKKLYPDPPSCAQMKTLVYNSDEIKRAIDEEASMLASSPRKKSKGIAPLTPLEEAQKRAQNIINTMFSDMNPEVIASAGLLLKKVWQRIYDNVKVGQQNIPEIQEAASRGPVIYIPTHRSYVDFLLVSYVTYMLNLPMPHIVAGEDFLGVLAVRWIFRKSGAFFIKRSFQNDKLYNAILQKFVDVLLQHGQSIEFFIEGTRSRSGKMLQPKMGMLSKIFSSIDRGMASDVTIVPISINYEKPMESFMYANELSGESKVKESLSALVRARNVITSQFGITTLVFGQPFSLQAWRSQHQLDAITHLKEPVQHTFNTFAASYNKFSRLVPALHNNADPSTTASSPNTTATAKWLWSNLQRYAKEHGIPESQLLSSYDPVNIPAHRHFQNRALAQEITRTLNLNNDIFGTHLLATILLQYRSGITHNQLVERMDWLRVEVQAHGGYLVGIELSNVEQLIRNSVRLLGQELISQSRKNLYEPRIANRSEYTNLLVLGQYKNKIIHLFYFEALWAVVVYSLLHNRYQYQKNVSLVSSVVQGGGTAAPSSAATTIPTTTTATTTNNNNNGTDLQQAVLSCNVDTALERVEFLHSLLQPEFICLKYPDTTQIDHKEILRSMVDKQIFTHDEATNTIEVAPSGELHFSFLCSLLWPFIDSLYCVSMLMYSLQDAPSNKTATGPGRSVTRDVLLSQSQWYANTLYHDGLICFFESCSKDTLDNTFTTFREMGVLESAGSSAELLRLTEQFNYDERAIDLLVDSLHCLRKQPPVLRSNDRRLMSVDLPMLAKTPAAVSTKKDSPYTRL